MYPIAEGGTDRQLVLTDLRWTGREGSIIPGMVKGSSSRDCGSEPAAYQQVIKQYRMLLTHLDAFLLLVGRYCVLAGVVFKY